jgi:hypothetical protein
MRRSTGVPSWVPLVKYTPRSRSRPSKRVGDEGADETAQPRELLRKRERRGAPPDIALLLDPREQPLVQALDQCSEFRPEIRGGGARGAALGRESHAPHRGPRVGAQIVEVLGEARDQVALRQQQVHRQAHFQMTVQLVEPSAHGGHVGIALSGRLRHEIRRAQGHDHAVQGPALAVLGEQGQEFTPPGTVGRLVRILCGVAPGRVEQHGFIGEPPITIARAADPAQRLLAEPLFQGKLQARIEQRGRLAGTRRPDDHVPRHFIQVALAARHFFQCRNRLLETFPQLLSLAARCAWRRALRDHGLGQFGAGAPGPQPLHEP